MDLTKIKAGDLAVFDIGFESRIIKVIRVEESPDIYIVFRRPEGEELGLYFKKTTGLAGGTQYRIAKVISDV